MTAPTHIQLLNTTELERSYTRTARMDIPSQGIIDSIRKAFARFCLRLTRDQESATVKKYQSTLNQLVTHAAKTKFLRNSLAKRYGAKAIPATSAQDTRNQSSRRWRELGPKIQAFYQALKERVELIEPNDSTRQAVLYRTGVLELTDRIHDTPMRRYVIDQIKERACADIGNKVVPQKVAHQQLKPLTDAINCFLQTFEPNASESTINERQRTLCDSVRQEILNNHAKKFRTQMDVLRAEGENAIANKEALCRTKIEIQENAIVRFKSEIQRAKSLFEQEKICTSALEKTGDRFQLDNAAISTFNKYLVNNNFKSLGMKQLWDRIGFRAPLSLDKWNNLPPQNKLIIINYLRHTSSFFKNYLANKILDKCEMQANLLIIREDIEQMPLLACLEERLLQAEQRLKHLKINLDQIRPKIERQIQRQVDDLILFTTDQINDNDDFYELAYPESYANY